MIDEILQQRSTTHGDFKEQAMLSQTLFKSFNALATLDELTPEMEEALKMIFHKIARIGAGNPATKDHWLDIAGYATLIARRL